MTIDKSTSRTSTHKGEPPKNRSSVLSAMISSVGARASSTGG